MDFSISAELQDLLDRIEEVVRERLLPLEEDFFGEGYAGVAETLEEVRREIRAAGLWAPLHPRELGGLGLGLVDYALVSESLGGTPLGHFAFGCQAPDAGNAEILHLFGSEDQQARYLRPLVAGEIRSCFAMTEVEMPGSDPVMMETRAVAEGDDYVIDGRKWFTTAADGAAFAVVMAVTDPQAPLHRRASMILVPCDTPGFERVRNIPVMGEPDSGPFSHGEVRFAHCRVPRTNRLGGEGEGFVIAQERLGPGRIHHCMRWLGICRRAFDLLCSRAATRTIRRDGQSLGEQGIVQAWIAESAAEIHAARWATLHTAWTIENEGFKAARDEIALIKFQVAGTLQRVLDRAIQAHGGLGMTDHTPLAYFFRHERASRIYDGPDEVHKVSVAKRLLRRFRPA